LRHAITVPSPGGFTDATGQRGSYAHEATTSYDLIAIGAGAAGRSAALQAARLGKRTALAEREDVLAGRSNNWGTLPSQILRAAIIELNGWAHGPHPRAGRMRREVTMDDLLWRTRQVIEHERDSMCEELRRNSIDVLAGTASFVDPHTLEVNHRTVSAERFVIAVGTRTARPPNVELDCRKILDADGLLRLTTIPETLAVVGGGVIGLEYASMAATLGIDVTVVERGQRILDFIDDEIAEALSYHLRGLGVVLRLSDEVQAARLTDGMAVLQLRSGEEVISEIALYAAGQHGATDMLSLEAAGVEADARGFIPVGPDFRTSAAHIFAAGEVGSPSLGIRSWDQGRLAALAAFSERAASAADLVPFAIYTIPELSFVGPTERELAKKRVPYIAGIARYSELARGEIAGDRAGLLKLLVHAKTRRLLGVHIFGTSATDLVHIGQTVIAGDLPVDYLTEAAFNMPTFSEVFRAAALDACDRLDKSNGRAASASVP
jgi:NAD(P) transhydrogenase